MDEQLQAQPVLQDGTPVLLCFAAGPSAAARMRRAAAAHLPETAYSPHPACPEGTPADAGAWLAAAVDATLLLLQCA